LSAHSSVAATPIEVYRVGGLHFVSDGHHRVSIAAASGQQIIDAYVTEILSAVPATTTTRTGRHDSPATNPERIFRGFRSRRKPAGRPD
jgi:hypothetical protein